MHAFHALLILLASVTVTVHSQQPKPAPNILEGKSIAELRKIAENLDAGKGSFEFVEAAYASGQDDVVALCWSVRTCGSWCYERLQKSQDPGYCDKQVLMMLRNGGADSWWPDGGGGLLNGAQAMVMETLGRMLKDYYPVWNPDYALLNSPEKRLAFADKLEPLIKAKHEKAVQPESSLAPSKAVPPNPAQITASPPKKAVQVSPAENSKPLAWIPWICAAAAILFLAGFRVLRRRK